MDSSSKSELLKKYWKGETSVVEEQLLKEQLPHLKKELSESEIRYFQKVDQFSTLKMKRPLQEEVFIEETRTLAISVKRRYTLMKMAASFLIIVTSFGIYHNWTTQKQQESIVARMAFEEARQSLLLMSSKLNKGTSTTSYHFNKFSSAQQKIKGE